MAQISYVNTVNVNIGGIPQGMTDFVVANIGLFTNETPAFADEYRVYVTPSTVKEDFGSDSLTYKMANAMFAQSPSLRSGTGSLIICPYAATSATAGTLTSGAITADKIAALKEVTDGEFIITVNGKTSKLSKLDFSSITKVDDIVTILLNKNPDVRIKADGNQIVLEAKEVGATSTVVAASVSGGTGTDVTGSNYLALANGTSVTGTNAIDVETLGDAVTRLADKIYFGGVIDTVVRENTSIKAAATVIEALSKKVYVDVTGSLLNASVLGAEIKEGGYKKTRILAYSMNSLADAKCMAAAYLSKALCTNYRGSNTCITMNLKELATIDPDKNCTDNTFNQAITNGFDVYGYTSGMGCVYSTKSAGGYMDDQTGIAALTGEIEVAAFNILKQTNTKVPQTETGMSTIKGAIIEVCERYVNNGFLGKGLKWNASEKFGDPEDFDRNIEENGYFVYSLPIAQQAQSEREARKAPLIQVALKSAGAVHIININGTVEA